MFISAINYKTEKNACFYTCFITNWLNVADPHCQVVSTCYTFLNVCALIFEMFKRYQAGLTDDTMIINP